MGWGRVVVELVELQFVVVVVVTMGSGRNWDQEQMMRRLVYNGVCRRDTGRVDGYLQVGTEESERMTVDCQSASQQSKQKQLELQPAPWAPDWFGSAVQVPRTLVQASPSKNTPAI